MPSSDPRLSLLERLDRWRRDAPDALAIVDYDIRRSRQEGTLRKRRSMTVTELWNESLALAVSLRRQGLGTGDIVALHLPNWHEYQVVHLALCVLGAVMLPVSPIFRKRDVARQVELAQPAAIVVPAAFGDFDYIGMATELRAEHPSLRTILAVGETSGRPDVLAVAELIAQGGADALASERERAGRGALAKPVDELMLLNFTSGTTGEPKGVMHSSVTTMSSVQACADRLELREGERILIPSTLGHAGGYLNGLYMPLHLRATVHYLDVWDVSFALQIIQGERITYGPIMPPHLTDLVDHPRLGETDISSWRTARVSGSAIPRAMLQGFQDQLPTLKLCPGWGMTEVFYATCAGPGDPEQKRLWTDGRLLDDYQLQVRDAALESQLPLGEAGEIVMRAPSQCLGYFQRQELTRAAWTEDGWFKTGDVGALDAEGYLSIVGRSKDLVVRGSENVPVVEVEHLLMEHPSVQSVAVIGVPDRRLGEKVCAVVTFREGQPAFSLEEMRAYLAEAGLTRQFIPELLVPVAQLPTTAVGKVKKSQLKEEILASLASASKEQQ